jgi:hypothetical protein
MRRDSFSLTVEEMKKGELHYIVYWKYLGLGGERELAVKVSSKGTVRVNILDVTAVGNDATSSASLLEFLTAEVSESPLAGNNDLLLAGELEFAATESLLNYGLVGILSANAKEDLANIHTSTGTNWLTKGTTHTSLQTIGTGTRQHFVDA